MSGKEGCSTLFRSQGWRNWAGNQRTDPARTVVARDTGDVVDAVKAAARDGLRVKAIGSGHSFTAIAVRSVSITNESEVATPFSTLKPVTAQRNCSCSLFLPGSPKPNSPKPRNASTSNPDAIRKSRNRSLTSSA